MGVKFPIFGQDKEKSMFIIETSSKLSYHLENIDIENKEYIGWDGDGKPIEFYLDNNEIQVRYLSSEPESQQLKQAILDYARLGRPKTPFEYSGSNVVNLFRTAEEHIAQGKVSYKIKAKLKNLWKKISSDSGRNEKGPGH
ncbi:MAG: hypothetical protein WC552_01415 [Candidatus Omnitrophota bacterium]